MKKYFKVVNPVGHHGMKYKEGYNEDIISFNPSGNCLPGGLYFTCEDIFAFWHFGSDVYEVEPIGEIYEELGSPRKFKTHALNMKNLGKTWDVEVIKYLVEHGANIHVCDNWLLKQASTRGYLNVIKYLVENGVDIHVENDCALRYSAQNGHLEIVKYLIKNGADIHAQNDYSLRYSAENGYFQIVKSLVENGADIHVKNKFALRASSMYGYLDIVNYLENQLEKLNKIS